MTTRCAGVVRRRGTSAALIAAAVLAVAGTPHGAGQQDPAPAQSAETFRSWTAALRVDVSVVDGTGSAVSDLEAPDFEVTIDGSRRRVLFARFYGTAAGAAPTGAPAPGAGLVENTSSAQGRAVALVVDLESIRPGNERQVLETASRLVESLGPNDAVSLVPVPGPILDLTRDRVRVAEALRTLRGARNVPLAMHAFTIEEALAFERRDERRVSEVVERECDASVEEKRQRLGLPEFCPPQLRVETRERLAYERAHIRAIVSALGSVAERLRMVEAPRTLLLVSGGFAFEPESASFLRDAGKALKGAGVALYALHVRQPDADASMRQHEVLLRGTAESETGLASLAGLTDGRILTGIGTAAGVFDRVRAEIAHTYELGVEATPDDPPDGARTTAVSVRRPGAIVRVLRAPSAPAAPADPATRLARLMSQPIDVPDLPIAASTWTVRGDEAATLKLIVNAEFGRGVPARPPIQYAMTIGTAGQPVFHTNGKITETPEAGGLLLAAQVPPGEYRLRLAAVDAEGRGGTLETALTVGLWRIGELETSDLVVAAQAGAPAPAMRVASGAEVVANLELYSVAPERFAEHTIEFYARRSGDDTTVATATGELHPTEMPRRQIARGTLNTEGLAPGEYTISAIVKRNSRPIASVSRALWITTPVPAAAAASSPPPVPEAPANITGDAQLDDVLGKLAGYVAGYGERTSVIVAVEKYTQNIDEQGGVRFRPRQLVAEFALVKTPGPVGWIGFRDVVEVNGEEVQDRRDRLMTLLTGSGASTDEAMRIADESARYNVGPVARNFNVPTTALFFFHPATITRFSFTRRGAKTIDGIETWEIAFEETARPTLVMTREGKDVPVSGTLWVAPADGTVVRTRLRMRGFADTMAMMDAGGSTTAGRDSERFAPTGPSSSSSVPQQSGGPSGGASGAGAGSGSGAGSSGGSGAGSGGGAGAGGGSGTSGGSGSAGGPSGGAVAGGTAPSSAPYVPLRMSSILPAVEMHRLESRADIDVTYRRDASLGMWLPSKMSEEYEGPITRLRSGPILGRARTVATYSEFRRFETSAKIVAPKEP